MINCFKILDFLFYNYYSIGRNINLTGAMTYLSYVYAPCMQWLRASYFESGMKRKKFGRCSHKKLVWHPYSFAPKDNYYCTIFNDSYIWISLLFVLPRSSPSYCTYVLFEETGMSCWATYRLVMMNIIKTKYPLLRSYDLNCFFPELNKFVPLCDAPAGWWDKRVHICTYNVRI